MMQVSRIVAIVVAVGACIVRRGMRKLFVNAT